MLGAYYDIPTKSRFSPYVGGAIGYTNVSVPSQSPTVDFTVAGVTGSDTAEWAGGSAGAFGYMAKLGVAYQASQQADVFLEGLYSGNTSVTINRVDIGALNDFGVRVGFRWRFDRPVPVAAQVAPAPEPAPAPAPEPQQQVQPAPIRGLW